MLDFSAIYRSFQMGMNTHNRVDRSTIDATMAGIGSKTTITGAAGSTVSFLLSNEFGILVGICIGLAGLLMNAYYSSKREAREKEAHGAFMQSLKEGKKE